MIEHVYKRASMALDPKHIFVTSGDSEILNYMNSVGANVIQSKLNHTDGTSRAAEAAKELIYESVIVLQADEILIDPEHIEQLLISIQKKSEYNYWNLITNLNSDTEVDDPNIVKCVLNIQEEIFFIFRKNPFISSNFKLFKKIMGTIAFTRDKLISLSDMSDSPLQIANSIEQLKIIEFGNTIAGIEVESTYPSINTQSDIQLVKNCIRDNFKQKILLGKYVDL
jgi:3-deoxy-manno-octulosonate cytidylyltransferase (CMP-KDO synthetase)